MPGSVKAFVAVSVGLALWWIFWSFHAFILPSPEYTAALARLPQRFRDSTVQAEFWATLISCSVHVVLLLTLSAFAAFARQNWARWTLVLYLIILQLMSPAHAIHLYFDAPHVFQTLFGSVEGWWQQYVERVWSHWSAYAGAAIKLLMIILIFSPNARPWFRRGLDSVG